jgi:hypothetical protein
MVWSAQLRRSLESAQADAQKEIVQRFSGRTRLGFNVRASARRRFYRAPPALFTMKVSREESAGEDVDAGVHPDDAVLLMRGEAGGQ